MIHSGMFIKHEAFLDICLEVYGVYQETDWLSVDGLWWNMGNTRSWPIARTTETNRAGLHIVHNDLPKWQALIVKAEDDCLRHGRWGPLEEVRRKPGLSLVL